MADAVIELLAAVGSRRVTHRAVDQHLGLPQGSTSAYFRTRASLLCAAADRLTAVDRDALTAFLARLMDSGEKLSAPALVDAVVNEWTAPHAAPRQLARLELQLELLRNSDLAAALGEHRSSFVGMTQIFAQTLQAHTDESADPALTAAAVTALVDGLILDRLLYRGSLLSAENLPRAVEQLAEGFHNQAMNRWRPTSRHRMS